MSEENGVPPPHEIHHSNRHDQEIRLMSTPPPRVNWIEMNTPELKLRQIRQYEEYVALRIECSITSGTPLTPSVSHVNEKLRKAHTTLAVTGITATQEMRRLKEKNLRRSAWDQGTTILANYGPITIYDARLRVAKDQHNRLAGQAAEEARVHTKEVRVEVGDEEKRRSNRKKMSLEADGLEIVEDDEEMDEDDEYDDDNEEIVIGDTIEVS
ncbi:hypothetical protein FocnCong_v012429 [Fusarium oxysporum f. sp. conglutinans]|nr:hypothetical protein FocnCong_v012429 [Fusarium oxysporum f. sp. conglutinans]